MCTYPPSKYIWAVIIATSLFIANYPTFLEDTMIWSVFVSLKNCYHDNWYLVFQIILTNSRLKAENMKKKLRWFQKLSYLKQRDKIVSQTRFLLNAKMGGNKYITLVIAKGSIFLNVCTFWPPLSIKIHINEPKQEVKTYI